MPVIISNKTAQRCGNALEIIVLSRLLTVQISLCIERNLSFHMRIEYKEALSVPADAIKLELLPFEVYLSVYQR